MYYIWIVSGNRCKDVYLPDQATWTGEINLGKNDIGADADISIPIRTLDGACFVACPPGFAWENQRTKRGEMAVRDGLALTMTGGPYRIGMVFSRYDIRNTVFKKYLLPEAGKVEIGRNPTCALCFSEPSISALHGTLEIKNGQCVYQDSSSLGSYVNGIALKGYVQLRFGDVITLSSGAKIVYLRDIIAVNHTLQLAGIRLKPALLRAQPPQNEEEKEIPSLIEYHHRMIRIVEPPDTTAVEIEPPPSKAERDEPPVWVTLGPSMTMVLPMAVGVIVANRPVAGLAMIGTSSLLAVFWGSMNVRYRKQREAETEKKRVGVYQRYIQEMDQELRALNEKEYNRLCLNHPDIGQCAMFPGENRRRLWERMPSHADFLSVRLGKGGVPLPGAITTQGQRLSLIDDPLRNEPQKLIDAYGTVKKAPVTLPLWDTPMVGVLGGDAALAFVKGMVLQLAVLHSYHDVKICVLTESGQKSEWEWARWLPHVFASEDRQLRMVVSNPVSRQVVLSHLDEVLEMRVTAMQESQAQSDEEAHPEAALPFYVVICTNPALLENKPMMRNVLSSPLGFSIVLLAKTPEMLPKECNVMLDTDGGNLITLDGRNTRVDFEYPHHELLRSFAKRIAPIRVKASLEDAAIPTLVTFLEIYGVRRVENLDVWRFWNENKAYEGLKSVVGMGSGGQPFVLDISDKAHGPHGLMAGTTGSGKSVMLETYILSLALNYHPDQVRFILIDYKGGGMADTFRTLPHTTGIIDNLQGERVINRALSSIQGEIHRRERIFRDAGVNNIDDYIRFFGDDPNEEKLPHLIIIVDEFAELRNEQPDFMRELVSASRVGRSLGLHLILATQKPSNSVSDEIWANTNFRICLRVQSRGDSMDMLHRPDAAYIKGMGRCFIQIGNDEIFEQVQTSYSGAAYRPDEPNLDEMPSMLDDAGQTVRVKKKKKSGSKREYTQMNAVLDLIQQTAARYSLARQTRLWLDELKNTIFLSDIPGFADCCYREGRWPENQEGLSFPFALADDVANQRYLPAGADLIASRGLMIVGLAGSGKTTLVQTMIAALTSRYDPAHLRVYVMSLSSRTLGYLSVYPHVGEIVYEGEVHETCRLLRLLRDESEARAKRFEAAWTNNFVEYNRSQQLKGLPVEPAITVFVDRMAQAREMLEDDEEMLSLFYTLIREGSSTGIYFVVTSLGGTEVPLKLRDCFRGVALQMRERGDYSDTVGKRVPREMPDIAPFPGRGIFVVDEQPYEIQCALPANAPTDVERAQALTALGQEMAAAWKGEKAPGTPRIPAKPSFADFAAAPGYQEALSGPLTLPLAYDLDSGLPLSMDLQKNYSFLVLGGRKSGKTNALMHIGRLFREKGGDVFVLGGTEWMDFCQETGASLLKPATPEWEAFMTSLLEDYGKPRKQAKDAAKNKDQLYQTAAGFKPFALLIDNLETYMSGDTALKENELKLLAFLTATAENSAMYTFMSMAPANMRSLSMLNPLKTLVGQQRGIVLGGRLGEVSPWNVNVPYRQKNAVLPAGTAYYISGDQCRQIVFPLLADT